MLSPWFWGIRSESIMKAGWILKGIKRELLWVKVFDRWKFFIHYLFSFLMHDDQNWYVHGPASLRGNQSLYTLVTGQDGKFLNMLCVKSWHFRKQTGLVGSAGCSWILLIWTGQIQYCPVVQSVKSGYVSYKGCSNEFWFVSCNWILSHKP